jgi:hypothetical protein
MTEKADAIILGGDTLANPWGCLLSCELFIGVVS